MIGNILVFGDSLANGEWDPEGGWAARLRKVVDQKVIATKREFWYSMFNLGIGGDDTDKLLGRFEFEAKERIFKGEETVFLLTIGINDSLVNNKTFQPEVSTEKFRSNLKKIINLAKKYSKKIVFIGTLPVDESLVDPIPWLLTHSYKNEFVEKYNEITKEVCKEEEVGFVEIYQEIIKTGYQKLLEDGVHGNALGHQFIFETVRDYLVENNIIDI